MASYPGGMTVLGCSDSTTNHVSVGQRINIDGGEITTGDVETVVMGASVYSHRPVTAANFAAWSGSVYWDVDDTSQDVLFTHPAPIKNWLVDFRDADGTSQATCQFYGYVASIKVTGMETGSEVSADFSIQPTSIPVWS